MKFSRASRLRYVSPLLLAAALALPPVFADEEALTLDRLLFQATAPDMAAPDQNNEAVSSKDSDTRQQTANVPATAEALANQQQTVTRLETEQGPFSLALAEQLAMLGALHEARDNHREAVAAYEQSMHVLRVNEGLFTLKQVPAVEGIVRNQRALGEYEDLDARQEYLYYLQLKNYPPGSPEVLQAKLDRAQSLVLSEYREAFAGSGGVRISMSAGLSRTEEYIPVYGPAGQVVYVPRDQLFGGSSMAPPMNEDAALPAELRRARELLREVAEEAGSSQTLQARASEGLANVAWLQRQQLERLNRDLRRTSLYQHRQAFRPLSTGFTRGLDALEDQVHQLRVDEALPEVLAEALTDLADWYLVYGRNGPANQRYGEAWALLEEAGWTAEDIANFFAATPFPVIPRFAPRPHSRETLGLARDEAVNWAGHIDAAFDVDRYGRIDDIEFLAQTGDTPEEVVHALRDYLEPLRVRPAIVAGEAVATEGKVVRFHYAY